MQDHVITFGLSSLVRSHFFAFIANFVSRSPSVIRETQRQPAKNDINDSRAQPALPNRVSAKHMNVFQWESQFFSFGLKKKEGLFANVVHFQKR